MDSPVRPAYLRPAFTLAALAVLVLSLAVLIQPVAAQGGPPGDNGTVKVDGFEFDQGPGDAGPGDPDNEPHILSCFAIDWYGFDQSTEEDLFYGTVTFQIWPPTGPRDELDGVATQVLHQPSDGQNPFGAHDQEVYIGEDSNAGGGSTEGRDASIVYDLSAALAAYEPHEQQGWHVKITVVNEGVAQNDATKSKVVWVEGPCASVSTTQPGNGTGTELGGRSTSFPPTTGGATGGVLAATNTSVGAVPVWIIVILSGALLVGSGAVMAAEQVRARRRT